LPVTKETLIGYCHYKKHIVNIGV